MAKWKSTSKKRRGTTHSRVEPDGLSGGFDSRERRIVEGERSVAREILGDSPDTSTVLDAARNALQFGESFRLRVVNEPNELACDKGCSWCCYLRVDATVPEVLALAEYIKVVLTDEGVDLVREQATKLARDPRILSKDEKPMARIPCALLLQDGSCGVYEARPLACRGWNSTDSETCRRGLDDPTMQARTHVSLVMECAAISVGLLTAMRDVGLRQEIIELTAGLKVALTEPDAASRWLAGEPIFASALVERSA